MIHIVNNVEELSLKKWNNYLYSIRHIHTDTNGYWPA